MRCHQKGLAYWEAWRARETAALLSSYLQPGVRTILDLGSGTGAVARELAGADTTVIALDILLDAIRQGIYSHPRSTGVFSPYYSVGDATRVPLRDSSVGFIYSYGALHHTVLAHAL